MLAAYPGEVLHRVIDDIAEIPQVLEDFVTFDPDVLVINGGDGTIQAVLTQSSRSKPFGELPPILVLPGGKTNLVAEDLGAFKPPEEVLESFMPMLESGTWHEAMTARPLIRLRLTPDAEPIYGAFFGTAAVVRALEFVRRHIHPLNLPNWATHFLSIGMLSVVGLFYPNGNKSPMRADFASFSIDDKIRDEGRFGIIIATTLNRLLLGLRPYPEYLRTPSLKVTTVQYSYGAIARGMLSVITRSIDRRVPDGIVAREAERVLLKLDCPITLDGEFFWPTPEEPVELSVTRAVTFLQSEPAR